MSNPTLLVVAKAPIPGLAKTRVAKTVGALVAAELAAAALLDTLDVAHEVGWPVVVAMTGDLRHAVRSDQIRAALASATLVEQRGEGLGERLAAAHIDADGGHGVVQVGMDTPQLAVVDLLVAGEGLETHDAAVAPAKDGGWWLLALRTPVHAECLSTVPMSRPDTCRLTVDALVETGADVLLLRPLADVDNWVDALDLAADHPGLRTSAVVRQFAPEKLVLR